MSGPIRVTGGNGKAAGADWDADDAARFRRPRQPVEVRRRASWRQGLRVAARVFVGTVTVATVGGGGFAVHRFATAGTLFRVADLEKVEVEGAEHVPAAAVRERFVADVGESIFSVPLGARRESVQEIAWVEAATVQRLLPNRLRVHIRERIPVAFLRQGAGLALVDANGVVLPAPEGSSYDFPVLSGLPETLSPDERRIRMQLYLSFLADLDREGKDYSARFSEVELSDPDDVRATVSEADGSVWLHFGHDRYQEKFETYLQHRSLWQQSGETVRSVDLRYRGQIVLNPDGAPGTTPR
ncbi:MAG: FtsQ-type POTRA domain-containing protein [Acidobacteria bacterium]|nr:FtsQ-type POTRA domain-containing protein [Acidobacteriota bacterium]